MKIGIMGGTFNPIHNGHLLIAEHAYDQFDLDQVWFMPAGIPPHKRNDGILDGDTRCKMVEKAICNVDYFQLCRKEVDSTEISYTYKTLTELSEEYKEVQWYFIMGADSLAYFDKWREPGIILEKATILVAVRDNMDLQEEVEKEISRIKGLLSGEIYSINTPVFNVSSREIRERAKQGRSTRFLVPDEVWNFMNEQEIYKE